MGGTLLKWLVLLVVVTAFALSNRMPVTVSFWQWPLYTGPLANVVVGAAIVGALLTYIGSVRHHLRQGQQVRSLQETVRAHEARQAPPAPTSPVHAPPSVQTPPAPSRPADDTRRLS